MSDEFHPTEPEIPAIQIPQTQKGNAAAYGSNPYEPYGPLYEPGIPPPPPPRRKRIRWILLPLILALLLLLAGGYFVYASSQKTPQRHKLSTATATPPAPAYTTHTVIQAFLTANLPLYHLSYQPESIEKWVNNQSIGPTWTFAQIPAISDATWTRNETAPGDAWSIGSMGLWVYASLSNEQQASTNFVQVQSTIPGNESMSGGAWLKNDTAYSVERCLFIGDSNFVSTLLTACDATAQDRATITASDNATATQGSVEATATASVPTPTPLPVINSAEDLYTQFTNAGIAMGDTGTVANSWWLQCCSYYPGKGSLSFIDEASGGEMVIALFNTVNGAQTDMTQMDANSNHPGDYQQGTCLLLYWSASTNLTPYEQVMNQYCT